MRAIRRRSTRAMLPGAVRVPVDAWDKAAKAADTGFDKTAFWDDALGALGVGPAAIAVTYDSGAHDRRRAGLVRPAVFWHSLRDREWRLARSRVGGRTSARPRNRRRTRSMRLPAPGRSGWSIGRR